MLLTLSNSEPEARSSSAPGVKVLTIDLPIIFLYSPPFPSLKPIPPLFHYQAFLFAAAQAGQSQPNAPAVSIAYTRPSNIVRSVLPQF